MSHRILGRRSSGCSGSRDGDVGTLPIRLDGARRILLIKPSALGDVVHALPVVATLKRRYPEIPLDWLIEEEAAPLVEGHPAVAEFVVSGRRRWQRHLRNPGAIPGALREIRAFVRKVRGRYDAVLDLQGLLKSALYVLAARAPIRVGLADGREGATWVLTHRVPVPPQPVHAVERYLALAEAVDAAEVVRDFTIPVAPADLGRGGGCSGGPSPSHRRPAPGGALADQAMGDRTVARPGLGALRRRGRRRGDRSGRGGRCAGGRDRRRPATRRCARWPGVSPESSWRPCSDRRTS